MRALSAGAALLLAGTLCRADVEERIAHCAEEPSAAARIACLEEELRELAGAAPATAKPGDARESRPAAASVAAEHAEIPTAPEAPEAAIGSPAGTQRDPVTASPPVAADIPASGGTAPAGAVPAPRPGNAPAAEIELGAEQVDEHEEETPAVRATVVDFRFVGYRRLLAQLDNGQVWQQIEGDRVSVQRGLRGEESFEVEMWATRLGGYRMRIVALDRTIRVERLR